MPESDESVSGVSGASAPEASGASQPSGSSAPSGSSGPSGSSAPSGPSGPSGPDPECFARGTLILTDKGEVPVQDLVAGGRVWTESRGFQPLRRVFSQRVAAAGDFAPILFQAGALGGARDLRVSPQHRMLISGPHVELIFGVPKALVAAKDLINDRNIRRDTSMTKVEYFHIMFDRHEIVKAGGLLSESYYPLASNAQSFAEPQRREFQALFPEPYAGGLDSGIVYPALLAHEVGLIKLG